MSLFNSKKEKKEETTDLKKEEVSTTEEKTVSTEEIVVSQERDLSRVILRPRITEKATDRQQFNVYTFEVSPDATKGAVAEAFHKIYKVTPVKVNITKSPAKRIWLRGKAGTKKGVKKACIYLKEGDKIELV